MNLGYPAVGWKNSQRIGYFCSSMAVTRAVSFSTTLSPSHVDFSIIDLNLFVGQLTPKQKTDPAVEHALKVQRAMSTGNYHAFFELYINSPNMGAYIMDHFIERERVRALMMMTKAYVHIKPQAVSFIHLFLKNQIQDATSLVHQPGARVRFISIRTRFSHE